MSSLRSSLGAGSVLALALALAGVASAQADGVSYVEGGEPGITILLEGVDLREARSADSPLEVDPSGALDLSIALAPPQGVTWEIRETRVAVLLHGPDAEPPEALVRRSPTEASIPSGFTVFVNRSFELEALQPLGTGLFLMRVEVADAEGAALYAQDLYVHVLGNVFLTVAGATAVVASAATGYGLWQIVKDLKEFYKARQRHRKAQRERKAARLATLGITASDSDLEAALDVAGDVDRTAATLSRRRPLAWAATGLGLGGVAVSWMQFLGRVPVDLGETLMAASAMAAAFLTGCLLLVSLQERLKERVAAGRVRRIPVRDADRAVEAPIEPRGP